jgi:DNA-binding NarL/FixJ family response regulator
MKRLNHNPDALSEMEIKVLVGTCKGLSSAEIAPLVYRSPRTVEKCRSDLYEKFYVRNKVELMEVAGKLLKLNKD